MPATSSHSLSFLWLEITSKCNLECMHCYSEASPRESLLGCMSFEKWTNVLAEAAALGCRQVQFIGGEPTLHPHLAEMISFAVLKEYTLIEVFTNATVLDDKLLTTFKENNVHVACSFYSDDAAIHDSITHHRGSFARTVTNIKRLLDAGISLRVGIIETTQNEGHAKAAERFLRKLGVSEISVDNQRKVGRGRGLVNIEDPRSELCGECSKGKLCVTASGETFPCVFSRFARLGNIDSGISRILTSEALAKFRNELERSQAKRDHTFRETDCDAGQEGAFCGPDIICGPDRSCAPNCIPGSSKCLPVSRPCSPFHEMYANADKLSV